MIQTKPSTALLLILILNIASTLFHYSDNFFSFERYPAPTWMIPSHVYLSWSILTPFALLGYLLYRQQKFWLAYACLFLYAITGTSSMGHYFYGSIETLSPKMNLSICLDVLCGIILIGFIGWSAFLKQEWQNKTL